MSEWSEVNDREVHCISCVACMQGQCRGDGCTPDGLLDLIHIDVEMFLRYLALFQSTDSPYSQFEHGRYVFLFSYSLS